MMLFLLLASRTCYCTCTLKFLEAVLVCLIRGVGWGACEDGLALIAPKRGNRGDNRLRDHSTPYSNLCLDRQLVLIRKRSS